MKNLTDARARVNLTQEEIGQKLGVPKTNISAWENETRGIPSKHWGKLASILQVTEDDIRSYVKRVVEGLKTEAKRTVFTEYNQQQKFFPVVSEAAAAECSSSVFMPFAECIEENAETERVYFPSGRDGDFVIRVTGTSMMPWYPPGTLLLVRPDQRIRTGQRVVAILEDNDVVFKIFIETSNKLALVSIDDNGKDYVYDRASHWKSIKKIFLVIEILRNEDAIDKAMTEAGMHHRWEDKLKKLENAKS